MSSLLRFVFAVALASSGAVGTAWANAVVIVAEGADFSPESLRTVRSIATTELRARGVAVIENERLEHLYISTPQAEHS